MKNWIKFPLMMAIMSLSFPLTTRAEWTVPLAGNTFRTEPSPGGRGIRRSGEVSWSDPNEVYSTYVYLDRPAVLSISLLGRNPSGKATLTLSAGKTRLPIVIDRSESSLLPIGNVEVDQSGYLQLDFQGDYREGEHFGLFQALKIESETKSLKLEFVRNNEGNMFYWGRRGPSVHLRYEVPKEAPLEYAYSEITVPKGQDPVGSFYMANGFAQGYFGFQVNSASERRILFSVWSPYRTDNPNEIPEDQRIKLLAKGHDVHVGEFGNEGSGGQSYLRFPWKAGQTYRFLTRVRPDDNGNTVYTSWFGEPETDSWRLIASFRRPITNTHLKGFHSFLESFSPSYGHIGRRAHYGNVWVRETEGQWHPCTQARFSVDATGSARHRVDFNGGVAENAFFLRNCGFFHETGTPGQTYTVIPESQQKPPTRLPRNL